MIYTSAILATMLAQCAVSMRPHISGSQGSARRPLRPGRRRLGSQDDEKAPPDETRDGDADGKAETPDAAEQAAPQDTAPAPPICPPGQCPVEWNTFPWNDDFVWTEGAPLGLKGLEMASTSRSNIDQILAIWVAMRRCTDMYLGQKDNEKKDCRQPLSALKIKYPDGRVSSAVGDLDFRQLFERARSVFFSYVSDLQELRHTPETGLLWFKKNFTSWPDINASDAIEDTLLSTTNHYVCDSGSMLLGEFMKELYPGELELSHNAPQTNWFGVGHVVLHWKKSNEPDKLIDSIAGLWDLIFKGARKSISGLLSQIIGSLPPTGHMYTQYLTVENTPLFYLFQFNKSLFKLGISKKGKLKTVNIAYTEDQARMWYTLFYRLCYSVIRKYTGPNNEKEVLRELNWMLKYESHVRPGRGLPADVSELGNICKFTMNTSGTLDSYDRKEKFAAFLREAWMFNEDPAEE